MKNFIIILLIVTSGLTINPMRAQGSLKPLTDPLTSAAVRLYPNPTNGKFCIGLKNPPAKMQVIIYNILGQKTYESSILSPLPINEINFSAHPKGVYFVKINDGENTYTEKIVVQ